MKKVMISQPMNGLTDEQIKETRKRAEKYLRPQGYSPVNTLFKPDHDYLQKTSKVKNDALYYLGMALKEMSECDTAYFCKGWENARGCKIEHDCAKAYGLEVIYESEEEKMRCKLDFNEDMPLCNQKIKAWGIMQSLEGEPCYRESDIKYDENRNFLEGYKTAIDDLYIALENLTESNDISEESAKTVVQWVLGELCMVLFGILDDEMVESEREK